MSILYSRMTGLLLRGAIPNRNNSIRTSRYIAGASLIFLGILDVSFKWLGNQPGFSQ
jgi:hypothetical protein